MRMTRLSATFAGIAVLAAGVAALAAPKTMKYTFKITGAHGEDNGTVTFSGKSGGPVKIAVKLKDIPFGDHGVHIHAAALCDGPDFKTAGGHFNPDGKKHGFENPDGHHNGDTPKNVSVGENHMGEATFELTAISLDPAAPNSIFANGGTSVIVHEKADDMKTDPSGNAGNRIACAVVKQ